MGSKINEPGYHEPDCKFKRKDSSRRRISVAKSAGFCFGVKRAVLIVEKLLSRGKNPVILEALIHNSFFNDYLKSKGVRLVSSLSEIKENEILVVRAHGITREDMEEIKSRNIKYEDATCPFVLKIHSIVSALDENFVLLLGGDKNHPETIAIASNCKTSCHIFKNSIELSSFLNNNITKNKKIFIVFQTTFLLEEYKKCCLVVEKNAKNVNIVNTICLETRKRQKEAACLSKVSDIMLIVGDKESSNAKKLKEVCKSFCKTHLIKSSSDLKFLNIDENKRIGVTAGASTPDFLIQQVKYKLSKRCNRK